MNLNQLRVFYESALTLNFSRAADRLFITQPAVSAQIKHLEMALNTKLFVCNGRKVSLTEAGKTLLSYAQKIFHLEAEAQRALEELILEKKGSLSIGTTKTYARYLMPRYVATFHALYPEVTIRLSEGSTDEMLHGLTKGRNELAIVAGRVLPKTFTSMPFRQERLLLLATPSHPLAVKGRITLEELAQAPLIMREEGSVTREKVLEVFKSRGLEPTVLYTAPNVDFTKDLIAKGEGVAFIWRPAVERELLSETLKEIVVEGVELWLDIMIVHLSREPLSKASLAFLRVLFDEGDNSA